jgi:hypothetical protein
MIIRWILWFNRLWHDYRDSQLPHVKIRSEWSYPKDGDYQ